EDRVKRYTDALREKVAEVTATENGLLDDRVHATAAALRTSVTSSLVGLLASFVLFAGALVAARRSIREREKAADTLHQEKERLRITLTSIGDAVVVTDHEGVVTMLNGI